MPRNAPTQERRNRRKVYKRIPIYVKEHIIDQVVMEGTLSHSAAARQHGLSTSTVRNIIDKYYAEGTVEPNPRGGRREECVKIEEQHGEYIQEILDEDCTQTLAIVKQRLEEKFPDIAQKNLTLTGLWHYIRNRLGFTLKRTKPVKRKTK